MTVFFTSDHHVRHKFVASLRWQEVYPDQPVPDVERLLDWHDNMLADRWRETVTKDDVVWVCGDLTIGARDVPYALEWIKSLPGEKEFVPGNHDPCHPMHRDSHKWLQRYTDKDAQGRRPFNTVQLAARRKVVSRQHSHTVLLSHMPYEGDHTEEDRFCQWRLRDQGDWLIHGHTHTDIKVKGRQIHVGVDAWSYRPVPLEDIRDILCGSSAEQKELVHG